MAENWFNMSPGFDGADFDQRIFNLIGYDINNNLSNDINNNLSNMIPPSQSMFDFDYGFDLNNSPSMSPSQSMFEDINNSSMLDLFDYDFDFPILPNMPPPSQSMPEFSDFNISILNLNRAFEQYITENNVNEADLGTHGAPPASNSSLKNLENFVIDKNNDDKECTICQETVNVGEVVMKLPCKHVYHDHCITTWLHKRNSCPVCRFELPTDDEEYEKRKRIAAFVENSSL